MKESGYYPPGTEFRSDAPWNEQEVPEREFNIYCSQTLSKSTTVTTNDYTVIEDGIDTFETYWATAYDENEHYAPNELIKELSLLAYNNLRKGYFDNDNEKRYLEHIIGECEDWVVDDMEIGEE